MSAQAIQRLLVGFYILLFLLFLFAPLVMMSMAAFNNVSFPQVVPWEGFTLRWFPALFDDALMMEGFVNSIWIGIGVVALSVPIGLAAAIVMTQVHKRLQTVYYTIVVSPVLMPGVILGISTLVFWDRLGTLMDADYESFYYSGMFLTVIGQSTFISAYTMLVFLARLQRFDRTQEEAALDLGATHVQVFWKILIPFMRPAIFSAMGLAFLTSFENYNTTVFTIQAESTLTTVLAGKVRMGTQPDLAALAVLIIAVTLVGAVAIEIAQGLALLAPSASCRPPCRRRRNRGKVAGASLVPAAAVAAGPRARRPLPGHLGQHEARETAVPAQTDGNARCMLQRLPVKGVAAAAGDDVDGAVELFEIDAGSLLLLRPEALRRHQQLAPAVGQQIVARRQVGRPRRRQRFETQRRRIAGRDRPCAGRSQQR